jgi:hypothetical protein
MDDIVAHLVGRWVVWPTTASFGTSSCRTSGPFLVLVERIEETEDKVMERKSFGMIMRAIFIP